MQYELHSVFLSQSLAVSLSLFFFFLAREEKIPNRPNRKIWKSWKHASCCFKSNFSKQNTFLQFEAMEGVGWGLLSFRGLGDDIAGVPWRVICCLWTYDLCREACWGRGGGVAAGGPYSCPLTHFSWRGRRDTRMICWKPRRTLTHIIKSMSHTTSHCTFLLGGNTLWNQLGYFFFLSHICLTLLSQLVMFKPLFHMLFRFWRWEWKTKERLCKATENLKALKCADVRNGGSRGGHMSVFRGCW